MIAVNWKTHLNEHTEKEKLTAAYSKIEGPSLFDEVNSPFKQA